VFFYPLVYLLTGVGISLATTLFLLPIFNEFMPGGLHGTAIDAVQVQSALILMFGLPIVLIVFVVMLLVTVSKPLWYGEARVIVDAYFPYSVYRTFESARFFKLVALLQRSEKSLKDSIEILSPLLSPYLRWHAQRILVGINRGQNKKEYFAKDLLSRFQAIRLHANLEQSARGLPAALLKMGETADFDAQLSIKDAVQNIRSVLLLVATAILLISILGFGDMLEQFILSLSTL
jgi:type II secretory pathway component PulF